VLEAKPIIAIATKGGIMDRDILHSHFHELFIFISSSGW
jgi:hypothetical protein